MNTQSANNLSELAYLVASVLFILGLKAMTHPRTAARGNLISAVGMLLAVLATVASGGFPWTLIVAAVVIGGGIGAALSIRVEMTKMPELVALFNGFGGIATVFVAAASMLDVGFLLTPDSARLVAEQVALGASPSAVMGVIDNVLGRSTQGLPLILSSIIGAVTFTGSIIAMLKLLELKSFRNPTAVPLELNMTLVALAFGLGCAVFLPTELSLNARLGFFAGSTAIALVLGVTLVLPIGGADMPVVVALLNSYSGLAAAAAGFVVQNSVLIVSGSLVGASGLILTAIMCKAMNRSLTNVLFGKIEVAGVAASADSVYEGKITSTSADEIAMLFEDARRVVIVPGYGMAVAQAQFAVRDLYRELESRGVRVDFAVHPVAGRMPGHMNVLLAEVDIPYDKLREMDDINPEFEEVDVAIVLGANDVVNPDGRDNPKSPIAGMPILDVDKARTVVVVKRSLSPGFAGIPNPLFAAPNTLMFFEDGKKATLDMVTATKSL